MGDFLYLDTARIGRPSPRTLRAATDSVVLAAEEGGSAYFDRFLAGGLVECPPWMQTRYPGLQSWRGVAALKADLRALVGGPPDLPVLLANRSAQLMGLAARLFFPRCHNVLTCDLGWPAYQSLLEREAARSAGRVTVVPLRDVVFGGRATADEVAEAVSRAYTVGRCDGLFLPAVSQLGVRLPVERVVRRVEAAGEVRLVVVDGAQDFCHAAPGLANDYCDLYLAGSHKWLGGHHPVGVGFYGRRRTRGLIDTTLVRLSAAGTVDDPLLHLCERPGADAARDYAETVSLSGLFTCQAAASETLESTTAAASFPARLAGRDSIARAASESGWRAAALDAGLRSAILLVRSERDDLRRADPAAVRAGLRERGVAATTYPGGFARLSMPVTAMSPGDHRRVRDAFRFTA